MRIPHLIGVRVIWFVSAENTFSGRFCKVSIGPHYRKAYTTALSEARRILMVNHCANPECSKPLHYLREGEIFAFEVFDKTLNNGASTRRVEHYWLCGECSQKLLLQRTQEEGLQLVARKRARQVSRLSALAS